MLLVLALVDLNKMQMDYSQLNLGFLLQCILSYSLERLLYVDSLLCGGFKIWDVPL